MASTTLFLGTFTGLCAGWILFKWLFEDLDECLAECGLRHHDDLAWQFMRRHVQSSWMAFGKLALVVGMAVLVGMAVALAFR